jgi:N4-gp56 family major capsid protein
MVTRGKYINFLNENKNKIRPDRLNVKDSIGICESQNSGGNPERKVEVLFRLLIGHTSNSLVLNEASARLGQSLRETEDQLIRDMLEATASIINCVGGTNGDNPTEITRADVDGVVATLQNNDGEFISEMIGGEDKFGTGPVRDAYFGLADSNMIGQLENVAGFINKAQYPNEVGTLSSEWGSISNIRFFLSSRGSVTGSGSLLGADVYNMFMTAQEAYCNIELDGASAQFIYHPPGWGDDPCELRQTGGYRFAYATRITNDAWVINLRATLA